jgi:hypothetical protein
MKTFFKETPKGALVESTLIGRNPNRPDESVWVRFKKETSGRYTVEIHSNSKDSDQPWNKENKPWNNTQLIAAKLYAIDVTPESVFRTKSSFNSNSIDDVLKSKDKLTQFAKKLTQLF